MTEGGGEQQMRSEHTRYALHLLFSIIYWHNDPVPHISTRWERNLPLTSNPSIFGTTSLSLDPSFARKCKAEGFPAHNNPPSCVSSKWREITPTTNPSLAWNARRRGFYPPWPLSHVLSSQLPLHHSKHKMEGFRGHHSSLPLSFWVVEGYPAHQWLSMQDQSTTPPSDLRFKRQMASCHSLTQNASQRASSAQHPPSFPHWKLQWDKGITLSHVETLLFWRNEGDIPSCHVRFPFLSTKCVKDSQI